MLYVKIVAYFLVRYDWLILSVLFADVWIFGIVNWLANPYRKQVKAFKRCVKKTLANPNCAAGHVAALPAEYRRQWRAYLRSGATRPSLVMEFAPHKNKLLLWRSFAASAVVSTLYLLLFIVDVSHRDYAVFQFAFWLSFVVAMIFNEMIFAVKEKRARQAFARLVVCLNSLAKPAKRNPVRELQNLKSECPPDALEQASKLLHNAGLDKQRTVDEQRKINQALNGLLQAYARKAAKPTNC